MRQRPHPHFLVNRELRRVPLTWQHPRDERRQFIPLADRSTFESDEVIAELVTQGFDRDELEAGYLPDFSAIPAEQLGICAYETTTEGTPVSPVFPDTPEGRFALADFCARKVPVFADTYASLTDWVEILFGDRTAVLDAAAGRIEIVPTWVESTAPPRR